MRLAVLLVGGVAVGAASAGGIQTIYPQTASMFDAVRALGGNPGSIRIGDSTRSRPTRTSSGRSVRGA
jgi:hypothetical protein